MPERLPQTNQQTTERGTFRKFVDKALLGVSFVTFPLGLYVAGTSLIAGEFLRAAVASGFAFVDYTQIKEHGRSPEKQSWYNPERILDKILGRGSNRLKHAPTSSMVYATA